MLMGSVVRRSVGHVLNDVPLCRPGDDLGHPPRILRHDLDIFGTANGEYRAADFRKVPGHVVGEVLPQPFAIDLRFRGADL